MESIGYVVSNKFILIAVDTNLELATQGSDGKKTSIRMNNIRKVYKVSDATVFSITGLPKKISGIQRYILGVKGSDKSFDSVVEDLEAIFNTSSKNAIDQIKEVQSEIPNYLDANGVVKEKELYAHFKDNPDLLELAKETISLVQSGGSLGTYIYVFGRENEKNLFGKYLSVGYNFTGSNVDNILPNSIYFQLNSAKIVPNDVKRLEDECLQKLQPLIVDGWENNKEDELKLKEKARELLIEALNKLFPFDKMTPNVIVYELSEETNNIFTEPDVKLTELTIK